MALKNQKIKDRCTVLALYSGREIKKREECPK